MKIPTLHTAFPAMSSLDDVISKVESLVKKVTQLETRLATLEARLAAPKEAKPKKKKAKNPEDPDAPKRPASAYILFSNAKRAEIVKANPGAKLPEVAKILGGMWKALTPEQQAAYKPAATA
jgi:cell division septum initiation protein DivIVA